MVTHFQEQWESWIRSGARNSSVESMLRARFRSAWQEETDSDRWAILYFIYNQRDAASFDLVVDGLRSSDQSLASHAAAIVTSLLIEGYELPGEVRPALQSLAHRSPELRPFTKTSLSILAQRDEQ